MSVRIVENSRVIAGIFRECILANIEVRVNQREVARIVAVDEADRRSKTDKRHAILELSGPADIGSQCQLTLVFSDFIASCETKVSRIDSTQITVQLPSQIEVSDLREDKRIEPRFAKLPLTTALLISDGRHQEVSFKLLNISRFGLAGSINVHKNELVSPGSKISGILHSADGKIDISGTVVSATFEKKVGDQHSITVRIVKASKSENKSSLNSNFNRRKEPRYKTKFTLSMRSILIPLQAIDLDVVDASIAGFSARCATPFMKDFLIPGVPLRLDASTMIANVIDQNEDFVRCHWSSGSEEDRSSWLKKIAKAIVGPVSMSLPDASKLIELFCSSGAFSSDFLRSQRTKFQSTLSDMEDQSASSAYIHRWIDAGEGTETVSGHISCIKIGDNCWFATDLVKSADEEIKLKRQFVQKFLHSFSHYATTLTPVPKIFLIWVQDHPYWANFERKILESKRPDCHSFSIRYTRTSSIDPLSDVSDVTFREVHATNYAEIERICASIGDRGTLELAKSFDFDPDRFGSPRLGQAISNDKKIFWRKYYLVQTASFEGLAIITALPDGLNPNRIIDSAWFFEFESSPVKDEQAWQRQVTALKRLASGQGLTLAGIRRVAKSGSQISFESEHADMIGFISHPTILLEFG